MSEIRKVFRDIKVILIATQVVIIGLFFLFVWWQHHSWTNFNQAMEERSAAFSAEMEENFQTRMAEERRRSAKIETAFQARMAEARRKTDRLRRELNN